MRNHQFQTLSRGAPSSSNIHSWLTRLRFTASFRSACVTAEGPPENSEKIASRHPVTPIANGLGGGVVGVDSRQLGQGNGHDSTVPADEHEHFSRAGIFRSHAMDFDGFPFPQR